jgi:hypothetical protein
MLRKLAVVVVILFVVPITLRAQVGAFVTSNAYVEADVSGDGQGLVSIFYAGTNHEKGIIHPSQTSYLTVLVNDSSYFTNNQHIPLKGSTAPNPPYPAFPAGFSLMEKRATKERIKIPSKQFGNPKARTPSILFRIFIPLRSRLVVLARLYSSSAF